MIESLIIKNFRVFESLEIERLGRVNLVVGKNGSGKTCLLDAVRAYALRGSADLLLELARERDEDRLDRLLGQETHGRSYSEHFLRNLFHGHRFPDDFSTAIEIGPPDGDNWLRIALRAISFSRGFEYRAAAEQDEAGISDIDVPLIEDAPIKIFLECHWLRGDRVRRVAQMQLEPFEIFAADALDAIGGYGFVPTKLLDNQEMSRYWNRIVVQPKLRDRVVKGLQLIEPRVQEVVFVGNGDSPVPTVLFSGDAHFPLRVLGDGAVRLFQTLIAMIPARGGFAIIDEVENGIHWSVQGQLWQSIFDFAEELDIQVFATTHSYDCVQEFAQVAERHDAEGMLIRLGRSVRPGDRGAIIVRSYDKEQLSRATKAELEVRQRGRRRGPSARGRVCQAVGRDS